MRGKVVRQLRKVVGDVEKDVTTRDYEVIAHRPKRIQTITGVEVVHPVQLKLEGGGRAMYQQIKSNYRAIKKENNHGG